MSEIVKTFLELVKIDSVSGEEGQVAEYIKNRLKKIGIKFKTDTVGNLYWDGTGGVGNVLYCAHMDTVEPGRGIVPIMKGGYVKSDGKTILGADNKAFVAGLICALERYVKKSGSLPKIELIFSVKEETGGGMDNFPIDWIKSKKAYLFDYGKPLGRIILAAPYIYNFKIVFKGKAAHASIPEEGINAICGVVSFLKGFEVGRFDEEKTTINVGKIVGGSGINTIPEEVIVSGEIRSTDKKCFDKRIKNLEKTIKTSLHNTDVSFELSFDGYCPGYEYKSNIPEIKVIKNIFEGFGIEVKFDRSTGVSDANPLSEKGIVAVNLSDGVEGAHTKEEKISIESLEKLEQIISEMFRSF